MIAERIVAALFNATWQTGTIVLVAALGLRAFGRLNASTRCAIWIGILLVGMALPVIDFAVVRSVALPETGAFLHASHAENPAALSLASALQRIAQIAFLAWLAGVAFCALRFAFQMSCLLVAKNAVEPIEFPGASVLPAARPVRLGLSDRLAVPCLLGFFEPVIALPRALAAELADGDLNRIVLHERAHAERRDDWFNLLEQIGLVLFFFNPAMHYVVRCIGMEREIACDDRVIANSENRVTYAACLSELAIRRADRRAFIVPGFFSSRRQIFVRIERLLDRRRDGSPRVGRQAVLAIGAAALCALFLSQVGIPVIAAGTGCKASSRTTLAATLERHGI